MVTLLSYFPHICDISQRSRTMGPLGGSTDTRVSISTGIKCWRQTASEEEMLEYQKRGIKVTDKVYFTSDPNVTNEMFITISNVEYDVQSRADPDASAGLGVVWRVMVREFSGDD